MLGIISEADLILKEEFPRGPEGGRLFQGRRQREDRAKAAGDTAAGADDRPAITIGPDATIAEAAKLLHWNGSSSRRRSTRPVHWLGIVSRRPAHGLPPPRR